MKNILIALLLAVSIILVGIGVYFYIKTPKDSALSYTYSNVEHRTGYYFDTSKFTYYTNTDNAFFKVVNSQNSSFVITASSTNGVNGFIKSLQKIQVGDQEFQVYLPVDCKYLYLSVLDKGKKADINDLEPTLLCKKDLDSNNLVNFYSN